MRIEQALAPPGAQSDFVRCGGFWAVWLDGQPTVRFTPGERRLSLAVVDAVLAALADAPCLLRRALRVRQPQLPWERVEISLASGGRVGGEACAFGSGRIRLTLGEDASAEDAAGIARHEAVHLLLAAALRGGEAWCQPDLGFADWIVRGIEAWPGEGIPRFPAPLPGVLDPPPASRLEVERRLACMDHDRAAAARYFGEPLLQALLRIGDSAAAEQRRLWLVEAALGTHYLEAAARLWADEAEALRPILLDDWLLDYQEYARGVANPPRGSGHLWRLSEPGWSREPVVRLSVAGQALQADDDCWFADGAPSADPVVWKNRGRVRVPLLSAPASARRPPLQAFRAALREITGEEGCSALALVEEAARGCERFEARALWPRILARLLAADIRWPEPPHGARSAIYVVDSPQAASAWSEAAQALRAVLGDRAAMVADVHPPTATAALAAGPVLPASILLVHGAAPFPASLVSARQLASRIAVRGALFFETLGDGAALERVPDIEEPLDPRYREAPWMRGPAPASIGDLVALADDATRDGQLTTPLSHLLSIAAVGLEECHSPRAPSSSLREGPR